MHDKTSGQKCHHVETYEENRLVLPTTRSQIHRILKTKIEVQIALLSVKVLSFNSPLNLEIAQNEKANTELTWKLEKYIPLVNHISLCRKYLQTIKSLDLTTINNERRKVRHVLKSYAVREVIVFLF